MWKFGKKKEIDLSNYRVENACMEQIGRVKMKLIITSFLCLFTMNMNAQLDFELIEVLNKQAEKNEHTVLSDFYCQLQKEPNLQESNTITLRRGQKYIFYFKGSKANSTDAEIKIYAPNNKQSFSKAQIKNNEIGELRLLSSITQNFIIEITKPKAGIFNGLVLVTLDSN